MSESGNILHCTAAGLRRRLAGTVTSVSTNEPLAALTFDDGPNPEFTPRVLAALERFQAAATFFMIGKAARHYPQLVESVARGGHAVGNHSWDHPSFPRINTRGRYEQIRACEKALSPFGQKLFRPPFGHQSLASHLTARCLGYQVIAWDVVAMDWLDKDAEWMAARVERQIQPGSIILFHDSLYPVLHRRFEDRGPTIRAVELLLGRLAKDFRFVTIPQLLAQGQPRTENWQMAGKPEFLAQLHEPDGTPWRYSGVAGTDGRAVKGESFAD
jgi:peptidoglycan/xylan/chitin deacetylase (PgdA/CDA1 family)